MKKPNCYKCKFRGEVAGSCHSSCNHPACKKEENENENDIAKLFSLMGGNFKPQQKIEGLKVKGHPNGIKNGWFAHPYNFDPVWLLECSGFKQK
jgi:hypothetical protein